MHDEIDEQLYPRHHLALPVEGERALAYHIPYANILTVHGPWDPTHLNKVNQVWRRVEIAENWIITRHVGFHHLVVEISVSRLFSAFVQRGQN